MMGTGLSPCTVLVEQHNGELELINWAEQEKQQLDAVVTPITKQAA